jgi:hypothetical protein
VESIRGGFIDSLQDGRHGVLDKLTAGHFRLNISQVQVSIEQHN